MEKKKGFFIIKLLIIIICISAVIVSLAVNIMFTKNNTPHIFGRYVYIVGDDNPMPSDVSKGSALLAKDASGISLTVGDIVLCYPADAPDKLCLRSVNYIVEAEEGAAERYYTKDSLHEDTVDSIAKEKVVAVCTGYPESPELGAFIRFAQGIKGIIVLLVVPSVILVIFIIAAIARAVSGKDDMDDEFDFYEYQDENAPAADRKRPGRTEGEHEFAPEQRASSSPVSELERKKMSIAENFSQKEVNHDSPYQKEKERTMQFKAQKGSLTNTMSFPTASSSAESSFAARNLGAQSGTAPTADALREEMLRKTAEAERTGNNSFKPAEGTSADITGVLSTAAVEQMRNDAPAYSAPSPRPAAAPRKSSTPDISDIISKTESRTRTKDPSDMSVDDLLKMIESEKNKL